MTTNTRADALEQIAEMRTKLSTTRTFPELVVAVIAQLDYAEELVMDYDAESASFVFETIHRGVAAVAAYEPTDEDEDGNEA